MKTSLTNIHIKFHLSSKINNSIFELIVRKNIPYAHYSLVKIDCFLSFKTLSFMSVAL